MVNFVTKFLFHITSPKRNTSIWHIKYLKKCPILRPFREHKKRDWTVL